MKEKVFRIGAVVLFGIIIFATVFTAVFKNSGGYTEAMAELEGEPLIKTGKINGKSIDGVTGMYDITIISIIIACIVALIKENGGIRFILNKIFINCFFICKTSQVTSRAMNCLMANITQRN